MAEIVGTLAASIEIGNTLLKLKKKVNEIREAPKEIRSLIEDTTRLSNLLSFILKRQKTLFPHVQPEHEICDIEDCCKAAADELLTCVRGLETRTQTGRWLGSLRAILKKDEIKAHQERLASAKLSLVLAQSTQSMILHHQQILQNLNTQALVEAALSAGPDGTVRTSRDEPVSVQGKIKDTVPNTAPLSKLRARSNIKPKSKNQSSYQVTVPARWLGWMLQLQADRYVNGWTFNFRIWNYVPDHSPIFECSRAGNIDALRSLLMTKQGFVTDIDSDGLTALHHVFIKSNLEAAKLLFEHGADLNSRDHHGDTSFQIFSLLCELQVSHSPDMRGEFEQAIVRSGGFQPIFDFVCNAGGDDFVDNLDTLTWTWSGGADILTAYHLQDADDLVMSYHWPPYKNLTLSDRVRLTVQADVLSPSVFLNRLGQPLDRACILLSRQFVNESGLGLWVAIARGMGTCIRYAVATGPCLQDDSISYASYEKFLIGWREILRQMVELGGAEDFESCSILADYFSQALVYNDEINDVLVTKLLQLLLRELAMAGMSLLDLHRFADHETFFLKQRTGLVIAHDLIVSSSLIIELEFLKLGDNPDMWCASVETYLEYRPSAEDLVETMPGSWNKVGEGSGRLDDDMISDDTL